MFRGWFFFAAALAARAAVADDDAWKRFEPPPDDRFDWIQLDSGEWLKGELMAMYSFNLEFDSDELGLLELDFDDVRRIRSAAGQRVLISKGRRDAEVARGKLVMDGDEVSVMNAGTTNSYRRRQIVSLADGARRERDNWSGSVSLGATLRGGNTETADLTALANLRRRTAMSRLNADYVGNYSATQKADTANNHRLNGHYDLFLSTRFYWQVLAAEVYRDPFVNIAGQYSVASGAGYDLIRSSRAEWTLSAGCGYQETRFDAVVAPDSSSSGSVFGTLGTRLDMELTEEVDYLFDYTARLLNEASGKYSHHMVSTLSVELAADLDLDVSLIWDRIEAPQAADDGAGGTTTPEQDDYQLVVGVAYDF